jgi:hypothetical protein
MLQLTPLPYHRDVVQYLKSNESEIWAWASSLNVQEQHIAEVRSSLLKETYRLDANAYSNVYAILNQAKKKLGVQVPVTLYQASEGSLNASLCYLPDEAHIVFTGPILDILSEDELLAVFGHELAHYLLWSKNEGEFHIADRILNHVCADPSVSVSHLETARLYALFTEIYADRGATFVAQSPYPSISSLVKVQTGMRHVDAVSYLQQAKEINTSTLSLSQGNSHPENYLRAEATEKWWNQDLDAEEWVQQYFRGPINLTRLDLIAQAKLVSLTRQFINTILTPELTNSEHILLQVKNYFPDWSNKESKLKLADVTTEKLDSSVLEYLNYVMLDLALADDDLHEHALTLMTQVAMQIGSAEQFKKALEQGTGFDKQKKDKLVRLVSKIIKG